MLSSLPPEIFDLIINHLDHNKTTLRAYCLVSKSWVPRIRRRLFACVEFWSRKSVGSWMEAFPDPANSPAHHTRKLHIHAPAITPLANSDARAWVRSFRLVVALSVHGHWEDGGSSDVVDFICSFPLLQDLWLCLSTKDTSITDIDIDDAWAVPPTSPILNGSFVLKTCDVNHFTRQLLRLPGGLHFSQISVSGCDPESIPDLVSRCSTTLESLRIHYFTPPQREPRKPRPLDLSKATNIKRLELNSQIEMPHIRWITDIIQSAEPENLQRIALGLYPPRNVVDPPGERILQELADLDHLLVKLWTSHSVLFKVICIGEGGKSLLPEITNKEGVISEFLVDW